MTASRPNLDDTVPTQLAGVTSAQPGATVDQDLLATLPAGAAAATSAEQTQDLTATVPMTGAPRPLQDAHDLQATIPMGTGGAKDAQDLLATVPMTGAAAARQAARSDQQDVEQTQLQIGPPADPNATVISAPGATGSAGTTVATAGAPTNTRSATGSTGSTRSGTMGGTQMGGTLSRTGTRLGRTRHNAKLAGNDQQLDEKLQLSRGSVLADMGTILTTASGGAVPKGLQKLIDDQGTEGRYHVNRPLAAGGMGAVLHIADNDFRRAAAMKVIHGRFAHDPQALERFLAEAQVTAQLEHPNIVPIHDMGVMSDGTLYFTMKLIEGMSLGDAVKLLRIHKGLITEDDYLTEKLRKESQKKPGERKGEAQIRADFAEDKAKAADLATRFTVDEILHIFLKVLDGCSFAHSKGVVHRDIKPDNIMLGGHGEVLVVDWGIAKVLANADAASDLVKKVQAEVVSVRDAEALSATMAGSAMGTIFYMPPEQATGDLEQITARSDIYALGATLYELLSLERCLTPSSIPEMIVAITCGDFVPLDKVAPELPKDLVAIVHRSMALTPEKRYATCDAFAEDLRRFMAGQAVEARKRGVGELLTAWVKQHKVKLITGAAGVVLVTGAITGTLAAQQAERQSRAAGLVAKARTVITAAAIDPTALEQAKKDVDLAAELDPAAAGLGEVQQAVGVAVKNAKDEVARTAALVRAKALAEEAATLAAANKLVEADQKFTSALEIDPTNKAWDTARQRVRDALADSRRKQQEADARTKRQAGDSLVAEARRLNLVDTKAADLVQQALEQFALSEKDGVAVPGTGEARVAAKELLEAHRAALRARDAATKAIAARKAAEEALATDRFDDAKAQVALALDAAPGEAGTLTLRDRVLQAEAAAIAKRRQAEAAAACAAAVAKGRAALDASNVEAARSAVEQALTHNPGDKAAIALQIDVAKAQEIIARNARRTEGARNSDARLTEAKAQLATMLGFAKESAEAQARADGLSVSLATEPPAKKGALWEALRQAAAARSKLAEQWALCEASASSAVAFVADFPEEAARAAAAKALLADLYHGRLQDARANHNLPEIAAFTNLLKRVDDGRYAKELAFRVALTVNAPAGSRISAVPVVEGDDTRLTTRGEAVAITPGATVELPGGAWELRWEGGSAAVVLDGRAARTIDLPAAAPKIAGHVLRWVPAVASQPAFWMAETEVTVAQYAEFLNAPEQIAAIRKATQENLARGDGLMTSIPPRVPLTVADGKQTLACYRMAAPGGDVAQARLKPLGDDALPVTNISRDDAEAYCAWLAKTTGQTVRLPLAAERAAAATGGDNRRTWPWGAHFDGQFAASAEAGWRTVPATTASGDVGPFGHRHLAGLVREWLGDRNDAAHPRAAGVHGALIAGGSWGDDNPVNFRSDYTESIDAAYAGQQIGFRILVPVK